MLLASWAIQLVGKMLKPVALIMHAWMYSSFVCRLQLRDGVWADELWIGWVDYSGHPVVGTLTACW
jgi:hypothetical protein